MDEGAPQIQEQSQKPKGYDELPKCSYCGRATCGSFEGEEICSPPYITSRTAELLSDEFINLIEYDWGKTTADGLRKIREQHNRLKEAEIPRVDKDETFPFKLSKHQELFLASLNEDHPIFHRIKDVVGLKWDLLDDREKFYLFKFIVDSQMKWEDLKPFFSDCDLSTIQTLIITEYQEADEDEASVKNLAKLLLSFSSKFHDLDRMEPFINFGIGHDSIRDFSEKIKEPLLKSSSGLEAGDVDRLAEQIFEALIRKMKDVMIKILASKDSIDLRKKDAILKGFTRSIIILNFFFEENRSIKIETIKMPNGQHPQFLVSDLNGHQYRLKFNIRPTATPEAQARINVEINFDTERPDEEMKDIFYQETEWKNNPKRKGVQRESVFRMGLDLDTTNPLKPGLSLDVGRRTIESEKRKATGESLGNLLAEASPESTHTLFF